MQLNRAIEGFILSRRADGISSSTIQLYQYGLKSWQNWIGNPEVESILPSHMQGYFAHLRSTCTFSESTFQVHWRVIRAFYTWASPTLQISRPDLTIQKPRPPLKVTQPFTADEIKRLIDSCEYTKNAATNNRKSFRMKRPTSRRDKAAVLTLLDTGLRASEFCRLTIGDVNMENGQVEVIPFQSGKKSRSRIVYLGSVTRKILWMYLVERDTSDPADSLFIANGQPMNRDSLRHVLGELGKRANVTDVHPHRFRHTFAIQYLRNGGDVFTLQRMLGHSTLEMVRRYLAIADVDSANAHRRASPVDCWKL